MIPSRGHAQRRHGLRPCAQGAWRGATLLGVFLLMSTFPLAGGQAASPPASPPAPATVAPPAALAPISQPTASPPPAPAPAVTVRHLAPGEAAGVLGAEVASLKGEQVGRIVDVLVDQQGHPRAAVIDFGGFMGIGNRKIAVDWKSLHFNAGKPQSPVVLDMSPNQIKATPEYKESTSKPAAVAAPRPAPTAPAQPLPAAQPPPAAKPTQP